MADVVKIIKGLEFCTMVSETCNGCPYENQDFCEAELKADALELLKAQKSELDDIYENGCNFGL